VIVVLALFGRELLRFEIALVGTAETETGDEQPEHTIRANHGGEFGFGASPARPYWTNDPDELPAVP
jgi:hypothetical protein